MYASNSITVASRSGYYGTAYMLTFLAELVLIDKVLYILLLYKGRPR